MSNLIGYHFVDQIYSDAHVAKHMDHLRATKPAWINVLGGAQYDQALNFAKLVRRDIPETRVIFRHYKDGGDNGMHTRLTADEWWTKIGSLYVGSDLTILCDNESGSEDLTYYSDWHARAMTLASQHGVSLAVARFSTHNPPAKQWLQLDSMWRALDHYHSLHIFSPNVYFSDTNFDGVEHIFGAWRRCADLEIRTPQTVIGEFAYAYNLDPHKGYKAVKMSSADYVTRLIQRGAPLWAAGIAACVYSIGEWPINEDTFGLDADALKALRARVVSQPPAPPPTENHPPKPQPSDPRFAAAYKAVPTEAGSNTVVRAFPDAKSERLRVIEQTGLTVGYIPAALLNPSELAYQNASGVLWQVIKLPDGRVGYCHSKYIGLTKIIAPDVPVPPAPEPPPLYIMITREELDAIIDKRVDGALMAFREELITALTASEDKQQRKTA